MGVKQTDLQKFTHTSGVKVHIVGYSGHSFFNQRSSINQELRQCQFNPSETIAHIHTCFSVMTEESMRFFTKTNIKYIFSPHGKLSPQMFGHKVLFKSIWFFLYARKWVNKATLIGLLSQSESILFNRLQINIKTEVIPNGYEFLSPSNLDISRYGRYIIFLGYLDPRKNPDFLINVFSLVSIKSETNLVLVGPDKYGILTDLEKLVDKLGLQNRIFFHGAAYRNDKWKLLQNAEALVLPSKAEGLPVVLCEALGGGVPSISSVESNFPEIAERNAGVVVDSFDEEKWSNAILSIANNPEMREAMAKNALNMSYSYTWPNIAKQWLEHYETMLTDAHKW